MEATTTRTQLIDTTSGIAQVTRDARFYHHFDVVMDRTGDAYHVRAFDHAQAAAKVAAKLRF